MFCRQCGSQTNETDNFCGHCGAKLKLEEKIEVTPGKENKEKTDSQSVFKLSDKYTVEAVLDKLSANRKERTQKIYHKNLSLKWFKFYTYFRIPGGILLSFLQLSENLFSLFDIVLLAVLFYGLYNKKLWAWKLNFVILILETIGRPIAYAEIYDFSGFGLAITLIILLFVWLLPNCIYFKKRKYLFH